MNWSGRDVTKAPVIGTIQTIELKCIFGQALKVWPSETLNIVEILEDKNGKIYITDKWYKSGVPQIVHEKMVKSFNQIIVKS